MNASRKSDPGRGNGKNKGPEPKHVCCFQEQQGDQCGWSRRRRNGGGESLLDLRE